LALNRTYVDKAADDHIRQLQKLRRVGDQEKRQIRKLHERIASKVAGASKRRTCS
jgi:hypothetical protein